MKQKASYTLEAALLMPLLFGCFIVLIYCSFYIHNRLVLEKTAYAAAFRGSIALTEKEETALRESRYLLEGALLGSEGTRTSAVKEGKRVEVQCTGKTKLPLLGGLTDWFATPNFSIKAAKVSNIFDTPDFVRQCKIIKDLISEEN